MERTRSESYNYVELLVYSPSTSMLNIKTPRSFAIVSHIKWISMVSVSFIISLPLVNSGLCVYLSVSAGEYRSLLQKIKKRGKRRQSESLSFTVISFANVLNVVEVTELFILFANCRAISNLNSNLNWNIIALIFLI